MNETAPKSPSVKERASIFEQKNTPLNHIKSAASAALSAIGYADGSESKFNLMQNLNNAKNYDEAQKSVINLMDAIMERNDSDTIKNFHKSFNTEATRLGIDKMNEAGNSFTSSSPKKASSMRALLDKPSGATPVIRRSSEPAYGKSGHGI